ncbi:MULTISPECIES: SH3 domain-containing protein [Mameliella]|uniref:SH3 domain-containing protein n=1 Tax=Mameliella TaxID=1434019 RepID=UPI000B52EAD1|nr:MULTISPECIES: SH3 domain-containing protein [Mameliella]MCR9272011.1 SH3 domain-containing protein [Paracoccaceae bacterium]OWV62787.1 hypothetical protein CDZ98_00965 [Mameliella alba]
MKKLILSAIVAATAMTASAASATQAWVGKTPLNARSGPSTHYQVLGVFNPCTPVHIVAYKHGWAKVKFQHNYYWVSSKYLSNHSCHWQPKKKKSWGHKQKNHYYNY